MYRLFTAARSAGTYAHGVLCLLVMLAVFRALIPTGFMPDPGALAQGRWALMLCPSAGIDGPPSFAGTAQGGHAGHVDHAAHVSQSEHLTQSDPAVQGDPHAHFAHVAQLTGKESAGHDAQPAGLECPYSLVTQLTVDLPPVMLAIALLPPEKPDVAASVPQSRPPMPPAGPPLGSRAPPFLQA